VAFLGSVALTVAACGSAGSSAGTTSSAGNAGLKFAQCMRSHGVPNFPDPGANGGGFQGGAGINLQAPAFAGAQQACQKILGPNTPRTPPTAAQNAAALKFAQCMRRHGVPNFPDPSSSLNPPAGLTLVLRGMEFPVGSAINPRSPAFQQAAGACGLKLPSAHG
jgi:hypothetical protein